MDTFSDTSFRSFLYRNPNFRIPLTGDFPANIGNTIGNVDLAAQQTIMYEIGLQQELFSEILE